MTKDEISKIKEHIEIHSKREPHAVKITEILRKAVDELEHITELKAEIQNLEGIKLAQETALNTEYIIEEQLQKKNAELKSIADFQTSSNMDRYFQLKRSKEQLTQAKELLKKIEKIVYNGENEIKRLSKIVDILAEAEQFLNKE